MPAEEPVFGRFRAIEPVAPGTSIVEPLDRPGFRLVLETASAESGGVDPAQRASLATIRHPNLSVVQEAGFDSATGGAWIAREHVSGAELRATVEREGPACLPDLAAEALRALGLFHDLGLVHGAIVPSRLVVSATGGPVTRLVLGGPGSGAVDLARDPRTIAFVAPEALDGPAADRRADLYALGAVLFHALHGKLHVRVADDLTRAAKSIREGRRSRPQAPAGAPQAFADWIDGLLDVDPAGRPASTAEAIARLAEAVGREIPLETVAGRVARIASGRPPGRDRECEDVWRLIERVDGPRLILCAGAGGSGLERVVRWVEARARAAGWTVLGSGAIPRERDDPGATWGLAHARSTLLSLDDASDVDDAVRLARSARAAADGPARILAVVGPERLGNAAWPDVRVVRLRPLDREIVRALVARAGAVDRPTDGRIGRLLERARGRYDAAASLAAGGAAGAGDARKIDPAIARERAAAHLERGQPTRAASELRHALLAIPRRDPLRAELRMEHGAAMRRAGRLAAAARAFGGAACSTQDLRIRAAARAERERARDALGSVSLDSHDSAHLEDTLARARRTGDRRLEACVRAHRAARRLSEGRLDSALGEAEAVDDFARAADDPRLRAAAACVRARVLALAGRSIEATATIDATLEDLREPDVAAELRQLATEIRFADVEDGASTERGATSAPTPLREKLVEACSALRCEERAAAERLARAAAAIADSLDAPGEAAEAWAIVCRACSAEPDRADAARRSGLERLAEAAARIADPELRRGFADHPRFSGLHEIPVVAATADRRLVALYEMIRRVNAETDPDVLLPAILDMALAVVRAERGLILLLADDGSVRIRVARNLERETLADAETFSRGAVAEAAGGRSLLAFDALGDERFADLRSVSLYGIRSLMCVPLRSRGSLVGTVYVDHRGERGRFDADDLRFLEAFADHAALALVNARDRTSLVEENRELRAAATDREGLAALVGDSEPMRSVLDRVRVVAGSDLPVLITGESGTGKELVARAIHFHGARRNEPFVSENCAALPETLLESELFGHVRGAFTGADRDRAGLFEQADGGTLLLDEVGDMSPRMQAQLLRVLETGEVRRVGSEKTRRVDVRVLAATHRDLERSTRAGTFRSDLLYRLQVLAVHLPPLRDRPGDVRRLVSYFLDRMARERGRAAPQILPGALDRLERHGWPGNVRELSNVLSRVVVLAGDGPIGADALDRDPALRAARSPTPIVGDGPEPLEESERRLIAEALRAAGGNRSHAARLLGISRATMYRRLRELDL